MARAKPYPYLGLSSEWPLLSYFKSSMFQGWGGREKSLMKSANHKLADVDGAQTNMTKLILLSET